MGGRQPPREGCGNGLARRRRATSSTTTRRGARSRPSIESSRTAAALTSDCGARRAARAVGRAALRGLTTSRLLAEVSCAGPGSRASWAFRWVRVSGVVTTPGLFCSHAALYGVRARARRRASERAQRSAPRLILLLVADEHALLLEAAELAAVVQVWPRVARRPHAPARAAPPAAVGL